MRSEGQQAAGRHPAKEVAGSIPLLATSPRQILIGAARCQRCGFLIDDEWCMCVLRRTFVPVRLQEPLGLSARVPRGSMPQVHKGPQPAPRAPRHTGGMWTCDHLAHDPTNGRGALHGVAAAMAEQWG